MVLTPRAEQITGASLTGSSGDTNRTYTLANSGAILPMMQILRASAILQPGVDFTLDTDNDVVTFITATWDDQDISLDYFTSDDTGDLGDYYTNTLQLTRFSGIGVEVWSESLGTGEGSVNSYDLNKGNVINSSYSIQYGDDGSNDLSTLVPVTDYSISLDQGLVLLTASGVSAVNGKVIFANYVYSPKHSDTLLTSYLPAATAEVDKLTGNYWGQPKTSVEYFDGYDSGYPQTDKPYGFQIENVPEFELKYKGINSITSVVFLDNQGSTERTLESTEYRLVTDDDNNDGRLLFNTSIPNGKMNIKPTYIHGYDTVPVLIQELASLVGGVMALVNISGGSYKDISTYTLGRKTFSIGQVYVNVRESINQMKSRIESITSDMGERFAIA